MGWGEWKSVAAASGAGAGPGWQRSRGANSASSELKKIEQHWVNALKHRHLSKALFGSSDNLNDLIASLRFPSDFSLWIVPLVCTASPTPTTLRWLNLADCTRNQIGYILATRSGMIANTPSIT
jgi:hypothetical protein